MSYTIINGRERVTTVQAWEKNDFGGIHSGRAVQGLDVDCDKPITVSMCADLLTKAHSIDGRDICAITIHCTEYAHDAHNFNECALPILRDDKYHYDVKRNTLIITKMGKVVYANIDGDVRRGEEAAVAWAEMP